MHGNSELSIDISSYYSLPLIQKVVFDIADDFFIENAKAEINIRLGQSKFRKGVLKNFGNKCALTGITELSLLTASHIVPWSHNKSFRGDISNGICLYIEYDALFDKGFISFTNNLEIIVSEDTAEFSNYLKDKLKAINGRQLNMPLNMRIKNEYLDYHRTNIFKG